MLYLGVALAAGGGVQFSVVWVDTASVKPDDACGRRERMKGWMMRRAVVAVVPAAVCLVALLAGSAGAATVALVTGGLDVGP